jgi:hypothetical protein
VAIEKNPELSQAITLLPPMYFTIFSFCNLAFLFTLMLVLVKTQLLSLAKSALASFVKAKGDSE